MSALVYIALAAIGGLVGAMLARALHRLYWRHRRARWVRMFGEDDQWARDLVQEGKKIRALKAKREA